MPSSRQLLAALAAAAVPAVEGAMGPAFSTGPVASNSFIREATSTLILPKAPTGSSGDLSLWVGMGTSKGDLIQSIADNWQSSNWAIFAYTLLSTSATTQMPVQSDSTTAYPGDQITMHYKYDDSTGNYTQYVSINGNLVHTLSTSDGHALGFGSAVECAETNCGVVPAHTWINTVITMDVADPNYINTLGKGQGVTGDMVTGDGGKTWTVSKISIPGYDFSSGKIVTASSSSTTSTTTKTSTTSTKTTTTTATTSTATGTAAHWAQCGGKTPCLSPTREAC
ncbi:hypothetical protein C8A01DRAFT_21501 [Parachaetomium inaequale]|uniref:Uncharacterized protein n=1 Tax=Parachaetomium inaequale TaxID=2588326 RepID=A0AAN6P5N6_9PEZI|nr:hypothetical protein C8A01DRAFT_21501 [Parachaetomium inaequale]